MNNARVRAEFVEIASDAVVEPRADREQHIAMLHRHVGLVGAVHAEHAEELAVARGIRAEPHQGIGAREAEPAHQLEYAAQLLRQKTSSGSSTVYANGLEQAAKQVLGKELNVSTIMAIIQALMGSSQLPGQQSSQASGGDMLGTLVGQLLGGKGSTGASASGQGLDLSDLLGAGMDYMSAKQSGKSDLEAITGALLNGSTMAETPHREQSGEVVTNALLGALAKMMKQ